MADTQAKDILVARHRDRNAACGPLVGFSDKQIAGADSYLTRTQVDVSSLSEIPSYGPTLVALWTAAKSGGLSNEDAAERILDWAYQAPPAWALDDQRKLNKLPGGFPGWEKQSARPEKELAFLKHELFPI